MKYVPEDGMEGRCEDLLRKTKGLSVSSNIRMRRLDSKYSSVMWSESRSEQ